MASHSNRKKIDDLFDIVFTWMFHVGANIIGHRACEAHQAIKSQFIGKGIKTDAKQTKHNKSDWIVHFELQSVVYKQEKTDDW